LTLANRRQNGYAGVLRRREKTQLATKSAGCAEMQKYRKIGCFIDFGETSESPDKFIFMSTTIVEIFDFPPLFSRKAFP